MSDGQQGCEAGAQQSWHGAAQCSVVAQRCQQQCQQRQFHSSSSSSSSSSVKQRQHCGATATHRLRQRAPGQPGPCAAAWAGPACLPLHPQQRRHGREGLGGAPMHSAGGAADAADVAGAAGAKWRWHARALPTPLSASQAAGPVPGTACSYPPTHPPTHPPTCGHRKDSLCNVGGSVGLLDASKAVDQRRLVLPARHHCDEGRHRVVAAAVKLPGGGEVRLVIVQGAHTRGGIQRAGVEGLVDLKGQEGRQGRPNVVGRVGRRRSRQPRRAGGKE